MRLSRSARCATASVAVLAASSALASPSIAATSAIVVRTNPASISSPASSESVLRTFLFANRHPFRTAESQATVNALLNRIDGLVFNPAGYDVDRSPNADLPRFAYENGIFSSPDDRFPESAYAHDAKGRRITAVTTGNFLMDPLSPTWRRSIIDEFHADVAGRTNIGLYLDSIGTGLLVAPRYLTGKPINPTTGLPWTVTQWGLAAADLARSLKSALGVPVAGNSEGGPSRFFSPGTGRDLLKILDAGASAESWLRVERDPVTRLPTADEIRASIAMLVETERLGAHLIAQVEIPTDAGGPLEAQWRSLAVATFLMGAGGRSSLAYSPGTSATSLASFDATAPRYDVGGPVRAAIEPRHGVFVREMARGVAIVNATDAALSFEFRDEPMLDEQGALVTSIEVPARSGAVVRKASAPVLSVTGGVVGESRHPCIDGVTPRGTSTLTARLALATPSPVPVVVDYRTVGGSARATRDFTPTSGTLTIPAGRVRASVTVPVVDDCTPEDDVEHFGLQVTAVTPGVLVHPPTALLQIIDDDRAPTATVGSVRVPEPKSSSTVNVPIRLSSPSRIPITLDWTTVELPASPSNAKAGESFTPTSGSVTFAPGTVEQDVSVRIHNDRSNAPRRELAVDIDRSPTTTPDHVAIARSRGMIDILEEPATAVVLDAGRIAERAGVAEVSLVADPPPVSGSVTARWTARECSGTNAAAIPSDFARTTGQVVLTPSNISAPIRIPLVNDQIAENAESVCVDIAVDAREGFGVDGSFEIVDDDVLRPVSRPADVSVTEPASGSSRITVGVPLVRAVAMPGTFATFSVEPGSADERDIEIGGGSVQLDGGTASVPVPLVVRGDGVAEGSEWCLIRVLVPGNDDVTLKVNISDR